MIEGNFEFLIKAVDMFNEMDSFTENSFSMSQSMISFLKKHKQGEMARKLKKNSLKNELN